MSNHDMLAPINWDRVCSEFQYGFPVDCMFLHINALYSHLALSVQVSFSSAPRCFILHAFFNYYYLFSIITIEVSETW